MNLSLWESVHSCFFVTQQQGHTQTKTHAAILFGTLQHNQNFNANCNYHQFMPDLNLNKTEHTS